MVDAMHRDEACISSTPVLGGYEGGWVRYWDETSTIAVLEFEVKDSAKAVTTAPSKEKKKKTKSAYPNCSTNQYSLI
jgi:RNA-binding protein 5/10